MRNPNMGIPATERWEIRHGTLIEGELACGHHTIIADTAGHSCSDDNLRSYQCANAQKIAAIPIMLDALKYVLDNCVGDNCQVCSYVKAVLQDATS